MILLSLFLAFLEIGAVSFGGGYGIEIGQLFALIVTVEPVQSADCFSLPGETAATVFGKSGVHKSIPKLSVVNYKKF